MWDVLYVVLGCWRIGGGLVADWWRIGGGLVADWWRIGGGLVADCLGVRSQVRRRLQETITGLDLFLPDVSVCSFMFHRKINELAWGRFWGVLAELGKCLIVHGTLKIRESKWCPCSKCSSVFQGVGTRYVK